MKLRAPLWRWVVRPLILGLASTVAVAWALATWLPQRGWESELRSSEFQPHGDVLFLSEYRSFGAARRAWDTDNLFGFPTGGPFDMPIETPKTYSPLRSAHDPLRGQHWGSAASALAMPQASARDGCEHATGWPMLAAWYEFVATRKGNGPWTTTTHGGITIPNDPPGNILQTWMPTSRMRALPFRPMWIGLAADTVFYGSVWALLLSGTLAARRAWRRRHHRCPRCAYDRTGLPPRSVCPECGTGT